MNPCATCSTTSPLSCLSCIAGYNFTNGSCVADTSCNAAANCIACAFGSTLLNAMTQGSVSPTCFACNSTSNCARCSTTNASQCLSCLMGSFLNNGACTSCPSGCSNCLSSVFCTSCSSGFIPQQSGSLTGNGANGPLNCSAACTSPCVSCMGTPTTCTSCNTTGFTLQGSVCLSNFNFQVVTVFGVNLTTFQANYLLYINQLAVASNTTIQNILVQSITTGSVTITTLISTNNTLPNSTLAANISNQLNAFLSTSNVANMNVQSHTVSTNGGSIPDNGGGGISSSTVLILAIVIPVGCLCTFRFI